MNQFFKPLRRITMVAATAVTVALITGCAHPISIVPDINKVAAAPGKINKTAAYYISPEDLSKEVETGGGGGDKVKYAPYRDLDAGLYFAFSQVFDSVVKLKSPTDPAAQGVKLVIKPSITTTSSSDSMLTWPPTQFSVDIACTVSDPNGKTLVTTHSTGQGAATFSEFKADFALSAKRASQDALNKLVRDLAAADALRN